MPLQVSIILICRKIISDTKKDRKVFCDNTMRELYNPVSYGRKSEKNRIEISLGGEEDTASVSLSGHSALFLEFTERTGVQENFALLPDGA